jgi:hypothetical protein
LARKRYQRGALRREGNLWILRWREDVLNKMGEVVRVERRARVGATKDLPTKALARRVADRMIEHVNQPNYMPGKVATVQEFSEVYCGSVCPTFKPSSCESARSLCRIYIEPVLVSHGAQFLLPWADGTKLLRNRRLRPSQPRIAFHDGSTFSL